MSINGDVLVKIAAGLQDHIPEELRRIEMQRAKERLAKDLFKSKPGIVGGPGLDYPFDENPIINEIPRPDYPYDDPRINRIPRLDRPVNIPKGEGESKSVGIGRAAGRAARTVRDGAVDAAREVGRSVSDAVRGFGQGWRGGR